jgi:hypothetical protein
MMTVLARMLAGDKLMRHMARLAGLMWLWRRGHNEFRLFCVASGAPSRRLCGRVSGVAIVTGAVLRDACIPDGRKHRRVANNAVLDGGPSLVRAVTGRALLVSVCLLRLMTMHASRCGQMIRMAAVAANAIGVWLELPGR